MGSGNIRAFTKQLFEAVYPAETRDSIHLNYFGANKLTAWMGRYLAKNNMCKDIRNDPAYDYYKIEYGIYDARVQAKADLFTTNDPVDYISQTMRFDNCAVFINRSVPG